MEDSTQLATTTAHDLALIPEMDDAMTRMAASNSSVRGGGAAPPGRVYAALPERVSSGCVAARPTPRKECPRMN